MNDQSIYDGTVGYCIEPDNIFEQLDCTWDILIENFSELIPAASDIANKNLAPQRLMNDLIDVAIYYNFVPDKTRQINKCDFNYDDFGDFTIYYYYEDFLKATGCTLTQEQWTTLCNESYYGNGHIDDEMCQAMCQAFINAGLAKSEE